MLRYEHNPGTVPKPSISCKVDTGFPHAGIGDRNMTDYCGNCEEPTTTYETTLGAFCAGCLTINRNHYTDHYHQSGDLLRCGYCRVGYTHDDLANAGYFCPACSEQENNEVW